MGFITPSPPPMPPADFLRLPLRERVRLLSVHWVEDGFGTPRVLHVVYILKMLGLYFAVGLCDHVDDHGGHRVHRSRDLVRQHRRLPEARRLADAARGARPRRGVRPVVWALRADDRQHPLLDPPRHHPDGALGSPRPVDRRRRAHRVRRRALPRRPGQPGLPAGGRCGAGDGRAARWRGTAGADPGGGVHPDPRHDAPDGSARQGRCSWPLAPSSTCRSCCSRPGWAGRSTPARTSSTWSSPSRSSSASSGSGRAPRSSGSTS